MERPNGRQRDQLRALLRRSPQENISGVGPRNHTGPLAFQTGGLGEGRRQSTGQYCSSTGMTDSRQESLE